MKTITKYTWGQNNIILCESCEDGWVKALVNTEVKEILLHKKARIGMVNSHMKEHPASWP